MIKINIVPNCLKQGLPVGLLTKKAIKNTVNFYDSVSRANGRIFEVEISMKNIPSENNFSG